MAELLLGHLVLADGDARFLTSSTAKHQGSPTQGEIGKFVLIIFEENYFLQFTAGNFARDLLATMVMLLINYIETWILASIHDW